MKITKMSGLVFSLLMVSVVFLSLSFSVKAYSDYEVKFRGTVAADEWSDIWLLHGSVYSVVTVDAIFYDPSAILLVGRNVTVIYGYSLDLTVGEFVDCFGVKDEGCRLDGVVASWFIRCWPEPYYVRRTPFFSMLSMILTLSYIVTPLMGIYVYRKRHYKASLKREIQNHREG